MIEGKPSHTAIHVAATRAAHIRFDPAPHLLDDHCAEELLGSEHAAIIETLADDAHWVLRENRLFVPLRARWVEDHLREAYARGVRHYVVLGAGLDSFAFRQPAGFEDLEIIEVDHPSTQRWKKSRLKALGWPEPENLSMVECDFERSSVSDALASVGYTGAEPAVVSWMGVIYYLQRATARAALSELARILGSGSGVLLDYMRPYEDLSPRYMELKELSGRYLQKEGEPHVNQLRPQELLDEILAAGFQRTTFVETPELERDYAAALTTDVPLSERFGLVVAST